MGTRFQERIRSPAACRFRCRLRGSVFLPSKGTLYQWSMLWSARAISNRSQYAPGDRIVAFITRRPLGSKLWRLLRTRAGSCFGRSYPKMAVVENAHRGTAGEVFRAFFKLGLTSFGGPIAHLG